MKSLRELYQIGRGPSSSHAIGPEKAAKALKELYPDAFFRIYLYGSLALTGRGHGTDRVLKSVLGERAEIIFDESPRNLAHPNTMEAVVTAGGKEIARHQIYSVGGGRILFEGETVPDTPEVYPLNSFEAIKGYLAEKDLRIPDYVFSVEPEAEAYLEKIWAQMKATVCAGLRAEGELPGGLHVMRKAKYLLQSKHIGETREIAENRMVCAYAFAVAEENAAGGTVVTAPTCGAAGVIPAVMYYMQKDKKLSDSAVVRALATAGLVGNLIKTNASISGAECGCQAEIGSACSMAAAGLAELFEMDIEQIEYAAEVAMEHHLGLTCDPVRGLVEVPCVFRNVGAVSIALSAADLALAGVTCPIPCDEVIDAMRQVGDTLPASLRETGEGGCAACRVRFE